MDQTQRALLSTLYERWYGVSHRYAQWAVGDALLAEEIVQETFLAAVPKIEELAAGGTSGAVADPDGKIQGRSMSCGSRPGSGQRTRCWRNPWLHPISWGSGRNREYAGQLWEKAAALLSPEEVALLRMVALEKLGHQAAAERLGLSLWSCQKRMQRIRKKRGPRGESWKGGHHEATGGDHAGIVPGGIGADASE